MSLTLHNTAYKNFRYYLDCTYSAGGGKRLIGFSTGYPIAGVFPLPQVILEKLSPFENGKEKPRAGYGWEAGSQPLREAIIQHQNRLHGTKYTMKNICMVAGATYGLNRILENLFTHSTTPSELLVVAPTFYRMLARAERLVQVRSVVGSEKNDFQITADELLDAITYQTRAIFLLNPSNPTYLYYDNGFLEKIIEEIEKRNIYLIIDESGDAFWAEEHKWSHRRFTNRIDSPMVIRIVTASKQYLFAEYRIGFVLANNDFMGDKERGFIKIVGDDIGNPPLAANDAWLEIIKQEMDILDGIYRPQESDFLEVMTKNLQRAIEQRDYAISILKSNNGVSKVIKPEANFNLTFQASKGHFESDLLFFKNLMEKTNVSLLPGSGLGIDESLLYFRLTYAVPEDQLIDGMKSLNKFLAGF